MSISKKGTFVGLLGLSLVGLGGYKRRRHLIARWLHLPPARYEVGVESGVRVPMRDGILLVADHYFPQGGGSFPTVLMRTPYGRDQRGGVLGLLHIFAAQRFAERGYHVIIQDTRGRFDSEGEFEPFVSEQADGEDTLTWVASQPWFNGELGMWGQSYEGYVQWAVAAHAPAYLKAMVPSITGSQLAPLSGSAFSLDTIVRWLVKLDQGEIKGRRWSDRMRRLNPWLVDRSLRQALEHLPIGEADALVVGRSLPYYQKWIAHPYVDDPFWSSVYHGSEVDKIRASIHLVSGWYDILLHQLLEDYAALRAAGHDPYLTIGPWRHLDAAGATEALRSGILWFEIHLKGTGRPLRDKPVRLYVMSAKGGTWREFKAFPPAARETRYWLHGGNRLSEDRKLPEPGWTAENLLSSDHYSYDPADPTPSLGGPLYHKDGGPRENRLLEARPDVLTFTADSLQTDVEVIGRVRLELYARSSAPSTDFFARLCDVHPDGRSINICDGLIRVEPGNHELQPDGTFKVTVDMWGTAYRFRRGHCIRLQVSSGAYPRWDRNLGTGEPIGTGTRMVVQEQTIYHDAMHPSALVLPVYDG